MGDDRLEPVGVPGHPVGHVAAERAAHRGGAGLVDVVAGLGGVGRRHQVGVRRLAPRAPAPRDEVEPVAGGQCRVGQQHGVPPSHRQPRVPAPRPGVPRAQRAAVDPEQERRGVLGGRTLGQRQPRAHARRRPRPWSRPPRAGRAAPAARSARAGRTDCWSGVSRVETDRTQRLGVRRAHRVDGLPVGRDLHVGVGEVVGREAGEGAALERRRGRPARGRSRRRPAAARTRRASTGTVRPASGPSRR